MERFDRSRAIAALIGAAGTLLLFAAALWMSPGAPAPAGALRLPLGVSCVGCLAPARQAHLVDVLLVTGAGLALGWWLGADTGTRGDRRAP